MLFHFGILKEFLFFSCTSLWFHFWLNFLVVVVVFFSQWLPWDRYQPKWVCSLPLHPHHLMCCLLFLNRVTTLVKLTVLLHSWKSVLQGSWRAVWLLSYRINYLASELLFSPSDLCSSWFVAVFWIMEILEEQTIILLILTFK